MMMFRFLVISIFAVMVLIAVTDPHSNRAPSKSTKAKPTVSAGISSVEALTKCQYAFKAILKDPERSKVPYVGNFSKNDPEWHFSWGRSTKFIRARNGLGNDVPASGYCAVNKKSGKITYMTFNGKTIIG